MLPGKTFIRIAVVLGSVISLPVSAQLSDSTVLAPNYMLRSHPWLSSGHVLGLNYLPVTHYSVAQAKGTLASGDFINFHESDNSLTLGAETSSYRRLSARTVLAGRMAYRNFLGKNMGGSAFLNPADNPFDINDQADTTTGDKRLELYDIHGAVSSQLTPKLRLGADIKYETGNYTKLKDLRHNNKLLRLDLLTAASWNVSDRLNVGLGYRFHRRIETVSFRIYGNTDRQYLSLINFGSFMGTLELYDSDSGYMADLNPLFDQSHGGSVTVNWKLTRNLQWFSELSYSLRSGYFGKKGTSQIMHTEHDGSLINYQGTLTLQQENHQHHLEIRAENQVLDNYQNVYRRETEQGGARRIVYYGQNKVLDRTGLHTAFTYTLTKGLVGWVPVWSLQLSGSLDTRSQTSTIYPYYRKQHLTWYRIGAGVDRNFITGPHIFQVGVSGQWGSGSGDPYTDGTHATPSSSQTPPAVKNNYLRQEYEYLTASRLAGSLSLGYNRILPGDKSAFVKISVSAIRASQVQLLGDSFLRPTLEIGYRF